MTVTVLLRVSKGPSCWVVYILGGESNGGHSHGNGDEVELHFDCWVAVSVFAGRGDWKCWEE